VKKRQAQSWCQRGGAAAATAVAVVLLQPLETRDCVRGGTGHACKQGPFLPVAGVELTRLEERESGWYLGVWGGGGEA
jgi:hypothetical protein